MWQGAKASQRENRAGVNEGRPLGLATSDSRTVGAWHFCWLSVGPLRCECTAPQWDRATLRWRGGAGSSLFPVPRGHSRAIRSAGSHENEFIASPSAAAQRICPCARAAVQHTLKLKCHPDARPHFP